MKQTTFICDACGRESPGGLATYKLSVSRPPEWYGHLGGGVTFGLVSAAPASSFDDRVVELCQECDGKAQNGELNIMRLKNG